MRKRHFRRKEKALWKWEWTSELRDRSPRSTGPQAQVTKPVQPVNKVSREGGSIKKKKRQLDNTII